MLQQKETRVAMAAKKSPSRKQAQIARAWAHYLAPVARYQIRHQSLPSIQLLLAIRPTARRS